MRKRVAVSTLVYAVTAIVELGVAVDELVVVRVGAHGHTFNYDLYVDSDF